MTFSLLHFDMYSPGAELLFAVNDANQVNTLIEYCCRITHLNVEMLCITCTLKIRT